MIGRSVTISLCWNSTNRHQILLRPRNSTNGVSISTVIVFGFDKAVKPSGLRRIWLPPLQRCLDLSRSNDTTLSLHSSSVLFELRSLMADPSALQPEHAVVYSLPHSVHSPDTATNLLPQKPPWFAFAFGVTPEEVFGPAVLSSPTTST
ncbi:hypothetical protein PGT21_020989 [Puccinia graminis f. sp. tritici]|uniref:Uncharacterized protein n=1 Tax=Puccinia graminis f. sp. tritici TaxID=56615 RepID=A0A5B0QG30_PUCGR|nr:hypothetical protein PGT21_020989 [Puccinia graminis f. sp. tritici]KAA1112131.1 hypothetical protein PGTUg99_006213 [Puccinia graminis f. sp. tritici]